jgi:hypothetical protein
MGSTRKRPLRLSGVGLTQTKLKTPKQMNVTITTEALMEAVQAAFELGKYYAADELDSCGIKTPFVKFKAGQTADQREVIWESWIESRGGLNLHSGDAKTDIVMAAVLKSAKFNDLVPMVRELMKMD